jgi:hypothetical protein
MLEKCKNYRFVLGLVLSGALLAAAPAQAKEFTYNEKTNKTLARKLGIPVYFALPASARGPIPADIKTTDQLIEFKHPDAQNAQGDIGLRLIVVKRNGMTKRLAKSGLVQTGDLLLTVRPEWAGAGAYPNVQMGVSHTGLAYIKDGELHNLDNPLNAEYLGARFDGRLTSEHYRTLNMLHIVRPRGLTEDERERILAWATRLNSSAKKIYPSQISFNQDYNAPKYQSKKPLTFVKQLGQIALGQNPPGNVSMFCSEFAWSVLALRDCDAKTVGDEFKGDDIPSCVTPIMSPLRATGNYVDKGGDRSYAGLADGPLLIINAMGLPQAEEDKLLRDVFTETPAGLKKLSPGHRKLAEEMKPKFGPLQNYYLGISQPGWRRTKSRVARVLFNRQVPQNYSPTSYLINTLLPPDHPDRKMDYIATIVIE